MVLYITDAQAIGNAKDGNPRQQLLDDLRGVFDSIKKVCTVTGSDDHEVFICFSLIKAGCVSHLDKINQSLFKRRWS